MNRPSIVTRFMANRFVALVLLFACGAVILRWITGDGSSWRGIIAVLTLMQTLAAVGKVGRYKAWAAKWQAMNEPLSGTGRVPPREGGDRAPQNDASPAKVPRRKRLRVVIAALLSLAIPLYVGADVERASAPLACLWLAVCLYLGYRLVRRTMKRGVRHREKEPASQTRDIEAPFVTCVLNRPSSSPSRAEAARNVPDYCARLLSRG